MTAPLVVAHTVPYYRSIEGETVAAQLALAYRWEREAPPEWRLKSRTGQGSPVMHNRNILTEWALADQGTPPDGRRAGEEGPPADVLVWQDSDVTATVEEILALVRALVNAPEDVGAIVAPCVQSSAVKLPTTNINFRDHPGGEPLMHAGQIVECSVAGFGLIATRASVYRAIGFPWFEWKYAGGLEHTVGEDMGWCEKARCAGYSIFVHGGVRPGHVFAREFRLSDELIPWLVASAPPKE